MTTGRPGGLFWLPGWTGNSTVLCPCQPNDHAPGAAVSSSTRLPSWISSMSSRIWAANASGSWPCIGTISIAS